MKILITILLCFAHFTIFAQAWDKIDLPTDTKLRSVQFIDPDHGWIVGDEGLILKYKDGDWISIESEFSEYNLRGLFFTDSLNGWIIGEGGLILKYHNDSVTLIGSPTDERLNDIYMIDEHSGWIVGDDRTILEYTQNTWSIYPTAGFSSNVRHLGKVHFMDSTFGAIVHVCNVIGFTVLTFEDGEWHEDDNQTNTTYLAGLFVKDKENIITTWNQSIPGSNWGEFINYNSKTGYGSYIGNIGHALGTCDIDFGDEIGWAVANTRIFNTNETGSFVQFGNYTLASLLYSVCMLDDSTGWIVGADGTLLKYNPNSTAGIYHLNEIDAILYPNPFRDYLMIESDHPINRIEMINLLGLKLESMDVNNETSVTINYGHLPSGIYFVHIISEDGKTVRKIVKE